MEEPTMRLASVLFTALLLILWAGPASAEAAPAPADDASTPGFCPAPPQQAPGAERGPTDPMFASSCSAQATNCSLSCQGTQVCVAGLCSVSCDGQTSWCCDLGPLWCGQLPCAFCACVQEGFFTPEQCADNICCGFGGGC
jgi:hypothetical protein